MSDPFPNPLDGNSPNPFEENRELPKDPVFDRANPPSTETIDFSPEGRRGSAAPILQKFYLILLACGLILGIFVSIGVVKVIQHLGLNDVPAQMDRSR
ncbi:MAG: hypothetical protein J7641_19425 [Cyanobacteria bacterium SID2]|nr:hypothetical protein [Cyanobacteria bacterium SID2]MBP0004058.1 hypothetical protein [Cyanobacteria bacterium SBC]